MGGDGGTGGRVSRRAAARAAGVAALAGGLGMAGAPPVAAGPAVPIVGAWHLRGTSPGPNRPELQYLLAFLPGGVFLVLDAPVEPTSSLTDDPAAIEYTGPAAGQWADLGNGEIRAGSVQLNYDAATAVVSVERATFTFTYDAATDALAGSRRWRETAPDGTEILANTRTFEATRIPLDP